MSKRMRFRMSYSQINQFIDLHGGDDGCPRKWGLNYLSRIPYIESIHAKMGNLVHDCAQGYYQLPSHIWANAWPVEYTGNHSKDENARRKAAALFNAMRVHGPSPVNVLAEPKYFHDVPELDTSFYIKPDLLEPPFRFIDWKSVSSPNPLSPFVLHPDTRSALLGNGDPIKYLSRDPQALIYAFGLMEKFDVGTIDARWVYGSKRFSAGDNPKTWTVDHTFEREPTREYLRETIWPVVRVMNALRAAYQEKKLDSPILLPHNPNACRYTGHFCDGLAHCQFITSPVSMEILTKAIQE